MQEVYFPVLFPEYIPPEGLEEALAQLLVTAAEVDQAARSIRLTTSGAAVGDSGRGRSGRTEHPPDDLWRSCW